MTIQRLSQWIALRCREAEFQRFLGVTSEEDAAEKVRDLCSVQSRAEFDRDPEAEARLHDIIRRPFIEFTHHQEHCHHE